MQKRKIQNEQGFWKKNSDKIILSVITIVVLPCVYLLASSYISGKKESEKPNIIKDESQNQSVVINDTTVNPKIVQQQNKQGDNVGGDKIAGDKVQGNKLVVYKKVDNRTTAPVYKNQTFIMPPGSEMPPEKNYQLENKIKDKNSISASFVAKPIQGTWNMPFFGIPMSEDSVINPLIFFEYSRVAASHTQNYSVMQNGITYDFAFIIGDHPANSSAGIGLSCQRKPSLIIFGDLADSNKRYFIKNPK